MKSLILTLLYLAKDTVNRWFTRVSSPLARVLVVYFLSLSALSALGGAAISTKLVKDKILKRGGDLVFATIGTNPEIPSAFPTEREISDHLNADSYVLSGIASATADDDKHLSVYTYDFCRSGQFYPLMATNGNPTIFATENSKIPPGPISITINRMKFDAFVRRVPAEHPLMRIMGEAGVLVHPDLLPADFNQRRNSEQVILRARELNSSADILRIEQYLRNFMRLEGRRGGLISVSNLLSEMDDVLSKQSQIRLAFCVGISGIVGILLTALAGMEYRQNEYIYTLMKSFGIRPILLVGAFIAENLLIVGASFAGALATFMYFQRLIVKEVLKFGNYSLSLQEILPEIQLICYTLLGCILISALPIAAAAGRDIGRVLK